MPKLKKRQYVRCSGCDKLIPLRSISTITVPKHRDPDVPSTHCPGSGRPIDRIITRYL
jgi:hypothetical protein